MSLRLHIYGPAFGLPSIDVECLAAIALLSYSRKSKSVDWHLLPCSDPSTNPFAELPALEDGKTWVNGFRNIYNYLCATDRLPESFSLRTTEPTDTANHEAYLSFLESRGIPLLDLSLYVSSDNYTGQTRSIFGEILSWPHSWSIPQRLREKAKKRSEHLGLNGLDVDATREKELKKESEGMTAHIPKSLRRSRQTVSALLGSTAERTRFRLDAITANFLEPLEHQLGDKEYLFGDQATAADCLAIAIMSQMLISDLPQPWLRNTLKDKHPKLAKWAEKHKARLFHVPLPWQPQPERSWFAVAHGVLDMFAEAMPFSLATSPVRRSARQSDTFSDSLTVTKQKQNFHIRQQRRQRQVREILGACISTAGVLGVLLHWGILELPRRQPQPSRRSFGEAGAFFGL